MNIDAFHEAAITSHNANAMDLLTQFNKCISYAASGIFRKYRPGNHSTFTRNKWFDSECKSYKAKLRINITDQNSREHYWQLRKRYKALIQKKKTTAPKSSM